jgi:SAM-dependent methyltransferase
VQTTEEFKPWPLEWSSIHIQRFWDWLSSDPLLSQNYFSRLLGEAILDEIARHTPLRGTVVDLGAGPGYLVEKLVARGITTVAVDTSPESVALLNQRLKHNPTFHGAYVNTVASVPLGAASADMVLVVEAVEHMDEHAFQSAIGEAYRILRPGGTVVVTTPNEEDLHQNQIMCPNCGCVFHKVQHVRSWSRETLSTAMEKLGFERRFSDAVLFSIYSRPLRSLHRLKFSLRRAKLPHLMYIGIKPGRD